MSEIPFYLKEYDPDILKSLIVEKVDHDKGTFDYKIEYYDPTDDNPEHKCDETGLVLKKGTGKELLHGHRGFLKVKQKMKKTCTPQ